MYAHLQRLHVRTTRLSCKPLLVGVWACCSPLHFLPIVKLCYGCFTRGTPPTPAQTGHITYLALTVLLNSISLMLSQTATWSTHIILSYVRTFDVIACMNLGLCSLSNTVSAIGINIMLLHATQHLHSSSCPAPIGLQTAYCKKQKVCWDLGRTA